MTKEKYLKMTQPFRVDKEMAKALHKSNKIITEFVFCMYPLLLLYDLYNRDTALLRAIIVPMDSFIVVTVFRYLINRQRPYEKFEIAPIIPKDTKGKSFPSRHVFSATVIAMTFLLYSPWTSLGWFLLVISVCLAVIRVLSGVHYISDVVAGMGIGILAGILGYIVL